MRCGEAAAKMIPHMRRHIWINMTAKNFVPLLHLESLRSLIVLGMYHLKYVRRRIVRRLAAILSLDESSIW